MPDRRFQRPRCPVCRGRGPLPRLQQRPGSAAVAAKGLWPADGVPADEARACCTSETGPDAAALRNLTEDADIGLRLSGTGEKIRVGYDDRYVTKEETPPTLGQFVRQRTLWSQGFMQTLADARRGRLSNVRMTAHRRYID